MRKKMSEIVDIIDGDRGTNYPKQDDFSENGFCLFLNTGNVRKEGFSFETNVFITKEKDSALRKGKLQRDDIVYTTRGTVGNVGYYSSKVRYEHIRINSGMVIFRAIDTNVSMSFLYHLLRSKDVRKEFLSYCTGSAQPQLPIKILKEIKVDIPDIEIQQRIVSILSSYDDLIENNQKQIKLLEEAAQRLYKEWFVDLRFPGYEDVEIVDGVPKGWSKKFFKDFVDYEIGGGWGEDYADREHTILATVIRGTDFDDIKKGAFRGLPVRYHKESNFNARKLEYGDIIFEVSGGSRTTGVAKSLLMNKNILKKMSNMVICASFCKLIIVTNPMYSQYIYDVLQYSRIVGITEQFEKKSASSIINYNWKDFLQQFEVYLPTFDILEKYNQIAKKLYTEQMLCCIRISELQEARDRLLPKLMSGEVEV